MEIEKLHLATLGALFHDIGKFYQRASENPREKKHYQFSADFLEEKREKIKRLFDLTDEEFKALKEAVEKHHERLTPSKPLPFIVQSADWLSSGLDRISIDEKAFVEGKNPEDDRGIYKLLVSPFALVKVKRTDKAYRPCITDLNEERNWGYKFKELSSENLFPIKEGDYPIEERKEDYKKLWERFSEEFEKLPENGDFNFRFEALRALLLRFMWCVPSYTYAKKKIALPDVSLAHHLLTSAAIATALWRYEEERGKFSPRSLKSSSEEKFIFLSVDFSGIQSFIFSPPKDTKKWAAKILRARSFVISLALETVVNRLIEEFGVNASSLLMNAGGKVLLLLPNLSDAENRIEKVRREVVEALLSSEKHFFGEVKLKIAYLKLSPERLKLKEFRNIVEELARKEAEARFKLFKPEDFDKLIIRGYCEKVAEGDESKKLCPVCGKAPARDEIYGEKVCPLCENLIKLGEKLPKSKYAKVSFKNSAHFPLPDVELFNEEELAKRLEGLKDTEKIYSFETASLRPLPLKPLENAIPEYGEEEEREDIEELVKRCYEEEKDFRGKPKNFCHISLYALEKSKDLFCGRAFLGVLKADVDNLGYIFARGFVNAPESDGDEECKGSIHSLSRFLQLSWFLDFFFSEVVKEKLIKGRFKNIYSVFSGGDDLFFIGPWNEILEFEVDLREKFKEFTCNNESFTLSVGIAVVKPNLPIYTFAREVEEALERSKREGKNSTTVFDRKVDYRKFTLKELLEVAEEIAKLTGNCADTKKISSSFLYKLLTLSEMANNEGKSVKNLLWRAYLKYLVYRNFGGTKEEDRREAEELFKKFERWIREYSEDISEIGKKEKDNLFYIPLAIAIYRRRRYEGR